MTVTLEPGCKAQGQKGGASTHTHTRYENTHELTVDTDQGQNVILVPMKALGFSNSPLLGSFRGHHQPENDWIQHTSSRHALRGTDTLFLNKQAVLPSFGGR